MANEFSYRGFNCRISFFPDYIKQICCWNDNEEYTRKYTIDIPDEKIMADAKKKIDKELKKRE